MHAQRTSITEHTAPAHNKVRSLTHPQKPQYESWVATSFDPSFIAPSYTVRHETFSEAHTNTACFHP